MAKETGDQKVRRLLALEAARQASLSKGMAALEARRNKALGKAKKRKKRKGPSMRSERDRLFGKELTKKETLQGGVNAFKQIVKKGKGLASQLKKRDELFGENSSRNLQRRKRDELFGARKKKKGKLKLKKSGSKFRFAKPISRKLPG